MNGLAPRGRHRVGLGGARAAVGPHRARPDQQLCKVRPSPQVPMWRTVGLGDVRGCCVTRTPPAGESHERVTGRSMPTTQAGEVARRQVAAGGRSGSGSTDRSKELLEQDRAELKREKAAFRADPGGDDEDAVRALVPEGGMTLVTTRRLVATRPSARGQHAASSARTFPRTGLGHRPPIAATRPTRMSGA